MNNLRLTIIMFLLAAALAPALIYGLGLGSGPSAPATSRHAPPIDPEQFKPAGLNAAPWLGSTRARDPGRSAEQSAKDSGRPGQGAGRPITLVELFTSEGCSSCPPAERLLSELAREYASDTSVFLLAHHVDYWDHLGWKDPFASAAATARQRAYSARLDQDRVYTPQMVVNGERGFVGSDRAAADSAIRASRERAEPARLGINGSRGPIIAGKPVGVECTVASAGAAQPAKLRLAVCLVEDGLVSKVKQGENAGRELKHDRVVRAFVERDCAPGSPVRVELEAPSDVKPAHATIVVVVHDRDSLRVLGAAELAPQEADKPGTDVQRDAGR